MALVPGWGPYQLVSGWSLIILGAWLFFSSGAIAARFATTLGWIGYLVVCGATCLGGMKLLINHYRRNRGRRRRPQRIGRRKTQRLGSSTVAYVETGFLSLLMLLLVVAYLLV